MDANDTSSHEIPQENNSLSSEGIRSIQGETDKNPEWIDRGIIDVSVADLPDPEGVSSPEDFDHHIKWDDARSATEALPQMQQEVKNGKVRDDFHAQDVQDGLDYQHGKERIYDLYFGGDPVAVDKVGDQYTIVSGRHRIFAAKEAGLETIPARVNEKVQ